MKEHLNNDQIAQRMIRTNSDIKRYLDLAPGLRIPPTQPKTSNAHYNTSLPQTLSPRPTLLRP